MGSKRTLNQDPEYEAISSQFQEKRIKLMEDSVRKQTKKKIESIIKGNFEQEKNSKAAEIDSIDELLYECRTTMDRLRACAITKYYSNVGQEQIPSESSSNTSISASVHPSVKKYLGKIPRNDFCSSIEKSCLTNGIQETSLSYSENSLQSTSSTSFQSASAAPKTLAPSTTPLKDISTRAPRFKSKSKIVIGNVSKFIPVWQRDESDPSTHKWMVYVRGDKNAPNIETFVKKVRFLLHPSYRPTDIVEISNPPFHLVKRGWGEFPVRVQLHFHDSRNKPVDIIHNLKLDKTYTGLQTLGAETVVELQLFKAEANGLQQLNCPSISFKIPPSTACQKELFHSEQNLNQNITIKTEPPEEVLEAATEIPQPIESSLPTTHHSAVISNAILSEEREMENGLSDSSSSQIHNGTESLSKDSILDADSSSNSIEIPKSEKTFVNGINTTYLKCRDTEGRVLLVPQKSVLCFKSPKLTAVPGKIPPTTATDADKLNTVPSYILKVVPNQDSGQNQVLLIPMKGKKGGTKTFPSGDDSNSVCKDNQLVEVPSASKPAVPFWEEDLPNIKLEYYKSFVELLKRVCRSFPLVKEGVDRSLYPFCACSLEEYLRWNIGKQRASEWRRAGLVRATILNLLKKHKLKYFTEDDVWSRSVIMSWCRRSGFVPMTNEKLTLLPEPKWSGVELCSLSSSNELMSTIKEENHKITAIEDEEEVEILDIPCEKFSESSDNPKQASCFTLPPLNNASVYIKNIASEIGVHLKPVEIDAAVSMPVVEEIILSACRQLASELIRSSLNEGYNRLRGQSCPEEVTVSDVYSTIKNTPHLDFLTNSYLGIPKEAKNDT